MSYQLSVVLLLLLPLTTFVVLGCFGRRYFAKTAGGIGTGSLLLATLLSFWVAGRYFFADGKVQGVYQKIVVAKQTWLGFSPGLSIDMGLLLDPLTVMMLAVVCFVSLMVHLFSLGYMKGEKRLATYFAFLSLFSFSMLALVLSSNIFQLYIFWELVGLSSFLLIGFYYDRPAAVAAAKKAFIVTRFADLGFLIGILILGFSAGSLDFGTLLQRLTDTSSPQLTSATGTSFLGVSLLTWALSLVFMGGAGKSAMFPLHIWLPDAMEGPTPVSALIHAATMVVAGVFLVARLFPLFSLNSSVMQLVTWVGLSSALLAAMIACTQTDIKRVLAYSTMSQIGYMMFALGISGSGAHPLGYTASLFHLFTHAFFKSLLFLCAGVLIHWVHSNELRAMGGLRKRLPLTHVCFLIACLAIAGLPPLAGFFSKEEILLAAYRSNKWVYGIALFTAMLTAFYMFRLYFSIFWKKPVVDGIQGTNGLPERKGSFTMKLPLVLLAFCSLMGGFVPFGRFVSADGNAVEAQGNWLFSLPPVILSLLAILLAANLYRKENHKPAQLAARFGAFYQAANRKFYIDEAYVFITRKVIFNLVGRPAAWIDRHLVDGMMNGMAAVTAATAYLIRGVQSGRVQNYVLYFFAGIAALVVLFVYLWK